MAQRSALVTGATGFVGSHLVRKLVSDGWETHVIVRTGSDLGILSGVQQSTQVHLHDGSTDGLVGIVKMAFPQVVFHLASLFIAQHTSQDIERLIHSNLLFSTQLAEAMMANGVYNLVNTGTSWQHFENKDYDPVCLYAATKQAFEAILTFYTATTSLSVITLKLFDTYGPDDPRGKLFALLRKVAQEQKPLAMSPGEQFIDLVYIDDVVDAFVLAAERLQKSKAKLREDYAVSSGRPMRLKEIVEIYRGITGKQLPIEWGKRPYRMREVMVPWNSSKILPGWQPRIGLEEGMKRMEHIVV